MFFVQLRPVCYNMKMTCVFIVYLHTFNSNRLCLNSQICFYATPPSLSCLLSEKKIKTVQEETQKLITSMTTENAGLKTENAEFQKQVESLKKAAETGAQLSKQAYEAIQASGVITCI